MADATQEAPSPDAIVSPTAPAGRAVLDPQSLLRLNNVLQMLTNGAWYIGTPFIPLYLVSHGASAGVVGIVAGLSGLVPLAVSLHAGALVDERGPTIVLVASVALFGLGSAMLAALHAVPAVTMAYTLLNIANIGLAVASQAVVANASTDATRIRNYGAYAVSYSAGAVAGPMIGGFLAARFGYATAFNAMAMLMVPSLGIAWVLRPGPASARRSVEARLVHTLVGTILRVRGVGPILFVSGTMVCAQAIQSTFYPLYLSRVGFSATLIGFAIAAVSLASMVVRIFLSSAVARVSERGTLIGSMALSGLAFVITPLFRHFWLLVGVSALMGASLGFTQPLSMSMLAASVADEFWGVAFGIRQSVQRIGSIVSPFVFGAVSAARGVEWAFYAGALVLFGAAGVFDRVSHGLWRRPS